MELFKGHQSQHSFVGHNEFLNIFQASCFCITMVILIWVLNILQVLWLFVFYWCNFIKQIIQLAIDAELIVKTSYYKGDKKLYYAHVIMCCANLHVD